MNLRFCFAPAAALVLAAASPACAQQDAATLKKDMIGQWELATTERSKTCVVTLKPDATPEGVAPSSAPETGSDRSSNACAAAPPGHSRAMANSSPSTRRIASAPGCGGGP